MAFRANCRAESGARLAPPRVRSSGRDSKFLSLCVALARVLQWSCKAGELAVSEPPFAPVKPVPLSAKQLQPRHQYRLRSASSGRAPEHCLSRAYRSFPCRSRNSVRLREPWPGRSANVSLLDLRNESGQPRANRPLPVAPAVLTNWRFAGK
jgi:hypothetical protein